MKRLGMKEKLLLNRFISRVQKVKKRSSKFVTTGCWIWKGSYLSSGYGQYRCQCAHRVSWKLHFGEIPEGLFVLHKCDNKGCVNPDHLFLGTYQDNMDDCGNKNRRAVGDKNGGRKYPERLVRGDEHYSRKTPEKMSRGEAHSVVMKQASPKGSSHYNSKLNEELVRQLRLEYSTGGVSITQLANRLGMSRMPVWQAIRGITWKHVK